MRHFSFTAMVGVLSLGAAPVLPAMAASFKTIYSFQGTPDGGTPLSGVISYNGLLYGTTTNGGSYNAGTVYAVDPKHKNEFQLYQFIPDFANNGQNPGAQTLALYHGFGFGVNTTLQEGYGTAFKINLSNGSLVDLYDFGQEPDPEVPNGVIYVNGALYGTSGGGIRSNGTVFELNAVTGAETTLFEFSGGSSGSQPTSALTYVAGALYGTTSYGGSTGSGVIFRIDPATGAETVLYNFQGGADGSDPNGMIYADKKFFGTTRTGGGADDGTVFSFDPIDGTETVLHAFQGASDGSAPIGGLVYKAGTLIGTTSAGGNANVGTIFAVNVHKQKEATLYSFKGSDDGATPIGTLLDMQGVLFGTASAGGAYGAGTVFSFTP